MRRGTQGATFACQKLRQVDAIEHGDTFVQRKRRDARHQSPCELVAHEKMANNIAKAVQLLRLTGEHAVWSNPKTKTNTKDFKLWKSCVLRRVMHLCTRACDRRLPRAWDECEYMQTIRRRKRHEIRKARRPAAYRVQKHVNIGDHVLRQKRRVRLAAESSEQGYQPYRIRCTRPREKIRYLSQEGERRREIRPRYLV